jgi:hypothetical protein
LKRRSREGRSMDRRLVGRTARSATLPAPPAGTNTVQGDGGREVGGSARRNAARRTGACIMGLMARTRWRATGSARFAAARTQLLYPPGAARRCATPPLHRNAWRHD